MAWPPAFLTCSAVSFTRSADRAAHTQELYDQGERAYRSGQFQIAYDLFKQAYLLSKPPALLYDMASALEGLSRPHDAAEELRAYLRAQSVEPRRAAIESRIRALEEAQRILDAELLRRMPPVLQPLPPRERGWSRKKIALTVVSSLLGAAPIGAAVGVGLALAGPGYPASTLGSHRATP